ncbi:pantetheine-phosphate adenylyltransferase [Caldanaerobius polysaccharolyticus]|uniref:pantetheine-phosphate adenylyltransferase n=1 Tax=Caldanaerobius polysaccharolyticus TaxID=44256 RepID=UPI00047CFAAA|nr:pantetheine-phosphate adenylyltransferase [Caldanaerobius polysaccharolyticus]
MKVAVYPGSFDPVTNGHIDIINRSAKIFDKLIVGVLKNPHKTPMFSVEERIDMLKKVTVDMPNVEVYGFSGLLVNFMKEHNASVIIKGLRMVSDFEYEFQMALMNKKLDDNIETLFMMTSSQYAYLSSSLIKEVAQFGGCLKGLVPDQLIPIIIKRAR